jgi:hypothetical protein
MVNKSFSGGLLTLTPCFSICRCMFSSLASRSFNRTRSAITVARSFSAPHATKGALSLVWALDVRSFLAWCWLIVFWSLRQVSPCDGTNSALLFSSGERKALAKSEVHQWSRSWVTVRWWSSSLISKYSGLS